MFFNFVTLFVEVLVVLYRRSQHSGNASSVVISLKLSFVDAVTENE